MRKIVKIFLYILIGILLLVFLGMVWLNTRWGKEFLRKQTVSFLSKKLGTIVAIRQIDYTIPDQITLSGVLFLDQQKDSLLSLGQLRVNMDMLALIGGKVSVDHILIDSLDAYIYRKRPDTTFNYQYIIDAFAGTDPEQPVVQDTTTSASSIILDIARLSLNHINLRYEDETGGLSMTYRLKHLLLRPSKIDLDALHFGVDELHVSGLSGRVIGDTSYLPPEPEDTTASVDFQLTMKKLQLDSISFRYEDLSSPMVFDIRLKHLEGALRQFGLLQQSIEVDRLQLEEAQSTLVFGKQKVKVVEVPVGIEEDTPGWRILADNMLLKNIAFKYDDDNAPHQKEGMDFSHLDFRNFFLTADQVVYTSDSISGNVKHISTVEKSGMHLVEFRSKFKYSDQGAQLKDFYLLTPYTQLEDLLEVNYPSLASLDKDLGLMQINMVLKRGKVGMKDVFLFLPEAQRQQLKHYATETFQVQGKITGYLNALGLQGVYLKGLNGTELSLDGQLKGLPDADKLRYDLNIATLRSTFADVQPFVPETMQQQFRLPDWFRMSGTVSGTLDDYYPDIHMYTADGDASVKGVLAMSAGAGREKYDLAITTNMLNLGYILKMDSLLGPTSVVAHVKGSGFKPEQMNTTFDVQLLSAWFKGYTYNHIFLKGNIADQIADIDGYGADSNLNFTIDARADLKGAYPELNATVNLLHVDPYALQLMEDSMTIKGLIQADFSSLNPDYPAGHLSWLHPVVTTGNQTIAMDSLVLHSEPQADSSQHISIGIDQFFFANMTGHIPLTQIGNVALEHINRHYQISDTVIHDLKQYDMKLDASLAYSSKMRHWFPSLRPFDTIKLNAMLDPQTMQLHGVVPKVQYGGIIVDSAVLAVTETPDTMSYRLTINQLKQDELTFWYPSVSGRLHNDSLYTYVNIRDSVRESQFGVGGVLHQDMKSDSGLTYFRLFKGLRFDYERWDVNPANRIVLGPEGFYIRDFLMANGSQSINIQNSTPAFKSPINITIRNFNLSNITKMISTDTLLADGRLQVDAKVDLSGEFPNINGLLVIDDAKGYNQPIGKITASVANQGAGSIAARVELYGEENNIELDGHYYLEPVDDNDFNFDLKLHNLDMRSMQGFAFGAIRDSKGSLNGAINLQGTTERLQIIGALHTNEVTTTVSMLNAPFTLPKETISFTNRGLEFDNFTILDKNKRKATVNGRVVSRDFSRYYLNLQVKTDRWQVINSTQKENDLFYGKLLTSANLNLSGEATAPTIDGNLTIHDSTNFYYALLDDGPGMQANEGIVQFIDSRDTTDYEDDDAARKKVMTFSPSTQMNVNVNIEKNAVFNVVIDPITGDNLQVKGEAALNTFIGPDGGVGLTGTYELNDGYYELNYNFLRRRFKIQEGSVVTLAGDPLDAEVNITAKYVANLAPYDLVERQVDQEQLVYYKQRLPFNILLKLSGKVLKPQVAFDVTIDESEVGSVSSDVVATVQRKLSEIRTNPSELNKQVFAALIFNRFIGDDPFSSGAGVDVEYAARQSVSRFLSSQLNMLADNLINDFEINLDLASGQDYSSGQKTNRTDLSISASKRLFNDRLTVTVGNDFQLEGQRSNANQQNNLIPGNISADYRITPDGRYMVRVYRKNEMQNVIEGYEIETGVTFRITVEYNKFRSLFMSRKKYREYLRKQRTQAAAKEERKNNSAG